MNSPFSSSDKIIKVLYIIGASRSGSTVLDTVLGNHSRLESVGELVNIARRGWLNNEYCACGRRGNFCPFWTEVRKVWIQHTGVNVVTRYIALQAAFEHYRRWPRLLKERSKLSPLFQTYAEWTRALFEAIRVVSGKSVIVDSSKNPSRAMALSLIPGIDLCFIHLIRDGRGVVWSHMKAYRKNERMGIQRDMAPVKSWRTSLGWLLSNSTSEFVLRQMGAQGIRIHYEDFVEQPQEALKRIGTTAKLDLTSIGAALAKGKEMTIGHAIAGNRVRMSGAIRLKADYEWKVHLPKNDRRIFWLLAGTLAKKYGYSRH